MEFNVLVKNILVENGGRKKTKGEGVKRYTSINMGPFRINDCLSQSLVN